MESTLEFHRNAERLEPLHRWLLAGPPSGQGIEVRDSAVLGLDVPVMHHLEADPEGVTDRASEQPSVHFVEELARPPGHQSPPIDLRGVFSWARQVLNLR